jgi:SET domain-containing protein
VVEILSLKTKERPLALGSFSRDYPDVGTYFEELPMLLVPVNVDKSSIHGIGIFAAQPIKGDTRIWQFTPGFDLDLDPRALEHQPAHFRATMLRYGYIDPRCNRFILCCDDYRFINHSNTPNVRVDPTEDCYGVDFAARDIEAGEELTVDYGIVEGVRPE